MTDKIAAANAAWEALQDAELAVYAAKDDLDMAWETYKTAVKETQNA